MGDEGASETCRQQSSQQPRIVIRKCKKSSKNAVSKPKDDIKKVNGELLTESPNTTTINNDIVSKEEEDQSEKPTKQPRKRNAVEISSDDDCIIVEGDCNITDSKHASDDEEKDESFSVEFKGFKKRIIAETEKLYDDSSDANTNCTSQDVSVQDPVKVLGKAKPVKISRGKKKTNPSEKRENEGDGDESQAESQAEYAQYLGLQPTMQFKCYRCSEKGFPSMLALNMHQRGCGVSQKSNFLANLHQDTTHMASSDPNMLTNFRITRKVYLCSACGTYYENWNLFLHMRDVHKKHICLYCLTMFTVANKLADHLKVAHSAQENSCTTIEGFQNTYLGSCYLICCSCENMYTERDDFFNHDCVKKDPTAKCPLCGVKCGHYYTCPNSNLNNLPMSSSVSVNVSSVSTSAKSQISNLNKAVSKNKKPDEHWLNKKNQGSLTSDNDDDYDISHAASFCHVDLADESGEKNKTVSENDVINVTDDEAPNEASQTPEKNQETSPVNNLSTIDIIQVDHLDPPKTFEGIADQSSVLEAKTLISEKSCKENEENEQPLTQNHETNDQSEETTETMNVSENLTPSKENTHSNIIENCDVNKEENNIDENTDSEKVTSDHKVDKSEIKTHNSKSTKLDEDKSQQSPHVDQTDTATSDSDRDEPTTYQCVSQDDTGSHSVSSSDEEDINITHKKSGEREIDTLVCESGDSEKSLMLLDEKLKSTSDDNTQETISKSHDDESGREKIMETKNVTSNEAENDFSLVDTSLEKPLENNPGNNDSWEIQKDEASLTQEVSDGILLADEDVPAMALTLEDKLEVVSPQAVVKECVRTSCLNCVYCSHAVKIAVNGKQLALHLLAEHRYKPIKNNETSEDVIKKLKTSLVDLEDVFFNTEFYDSSEKPLNMSYDHIYECFQCRFVTKVHKELYNHKKKMHQKTVLLCVMCKANFFSYSELLCHMCPGIYVSENINFRCCFCNLDMIPSAFRLMVHLRKSHHTCDICLEIADDQQKLSTHMWKHKLSHMCYRCGIAYRNKPDITKHLFWKHGTESVLCKKCLQKKWPHVYHFCIPPTVFICEECNASFTKAVALKVHKRYHGGDLPYECNKCEAKFVSKKLLAKHEDTHNFAKSCPNLPLPGENFNDNGAESMFNKSNEEHINVESLDEAGGENATEDCVSKLKPIDNKDSSESHGLKSRKKKKKDKDRKEKPVVDVYDLPPLNLSSESDSSDEDTKTVTSESIKEIQPSHESDVDSKILEDRNEKQVTSSSEMEAPEESATPVPIVDGVWDNFHSYKAELEKRESKDLSLPNILPSTSDHPKVVITNPPQLEIDLVLLDHTYCLIPGKPKTSETDDNPTLSEPAAVEEQNQTPSEDIPAPRGHSSSIDHAYATTTNTNTDGNSIDAVQEKISLEDNSSTPLSQAVNASELDSGPKKKLKTPKKKKHGENSSSSSDSSSDSDSSSCTCGPDCSCSNTSSSSSSSSSDSESSTSEGRQRAADRREKRKDKLKHKHHKEEPEQVSQITPVPPPVEEPVIDTHVEPIELPVRESDLDTDESSTDEDFYDKCPQTHGKQEIENRNKLLFLASVAPVNNGNVSPTPPSTASPPSTAPPPPVKEKTPPPPTSAKRKVKTKRRRKSQQSKKHTNKDNIQPHQMHPSTMNLQMISSTSPHVSNHQSITSRVSLPLRTSVGSFQSDATAGSGSENDSARLSKRKRVRNKFYGYSSDEEDEKPAFKWKKTDTISAPTQIQRPALTLQQSFPHQQPHNSVSQGKKTKPSESSETEEDRVIKQDASSNSSSSSESENELEPKLVIQKDKEQTEKSDNLYCYCQCPYDEVSEMIACDGEDCTIEWFHFECVGIMVPPKGKWYCPDCRKRRGLM